MWNIIQSPLVAMIFVIIVAAVDIVLGESTNYGLNLYSYRAIQAALVLLFLGAIWLGVMVVVGWVRRGRNSSTEKRFNLT